jgi:hypothetical protein
VLRRLVEGLAEGDEAHARENTERHELFGDAGVRRRGRREGRRQMSATWTRRGLGRGDEVHA